MGGEHRQYGLRGEEIDETQERGKGNDHGPEKHARGISIGMRLA
jgi:hypothetical protein